MQDTKQSARWWMGTLNNPTGDLRSYLEQFPGVTYAVGQLEVGEGGTPHWQFCFGMAKPQRLSALKKLCDRAHFEVVRDQARAVAYCQKTETRAGDVVEVGTMPFKRNDAKDWERARQLAKEGKLDEIPADIAIPHYRNLKAIAADAAAQQPTQATTKGIWVFGKSGCGKSSTVRKLWPDAYAKPQNKWWDGYQGEDTVLLDDFDRGGACLAHYLKIWADHYGCQLEVKGGTTRSNFSRFVITSQYCPADLFDDLPVLDAINRRFRLATPTGPMGDLTYHSWEEFTSLVHPPLNSDR